MAFHVGQKVVCVERCIRDGRGYGDEVFPILNEIYTIREMLDIEGHAAVRVCEIKNKPHRYFFGGKDLGRIEPPFPEWVFRAAVERSTETGMAILRKVAADISAKVTVRAKAPSSERA